MQFFDISSSTYIDSSLKKMSSKGNIGYHLIILKYKNIFSKGKIPN